MSRLAVGETRSVAFSSDGELLAIGSKDGEVTVITVPSMKIWAKKRDRKSTINDIR